MLPESPKLWRCALRARDTAGLFAQLSRLRAQAAGGEVGAEPDAAEVVCIQEAGLDGFWLHRLLQAAGVQSLVVDAASVPVPRRRRRAKTDVIDGETLLRTLAAWRRGEPRVCSMVRPPSPEQEDERRLVRERAALLAERIRQVNRIRGLLASQGIVDFDPLRRDAPTRLERLATGDGRGVPARLKAELRRSLERLVLLMRQIAEIEAERDAALAALAPDRPAGLLLRLRGIGTQLAAVLSLEGLNRAFANRRQVAAYGGLAASPWQSGGIAREQGITKAGNPRLRTAMVELAWLWLRYQPGSALARWYRQRVGRQRGRIRRVMIIALARKLLVALWQYVTAGVLPDGAVLKPTRA